MEGLRWVEVDSYRQLQQVASESRAGSAWPQSIRDSKKYHVLCDSLATLPTAVVELAAEYAYTVQLQTEPMSTKRAFQKGQALVSTETASSNPPLLLMPNLCTDPALLRAQRVCPQSDAG